MNNNYHNAKVYLSTDLVPINHISLNTFYHHLIGSEGIYLYYQLHNTQQILLNLKGKGWIQLKDLLNDLNLQETEFDQTKGLLEQAGLLKTNFSSINDQKLFSLELLKPVSLETILSNEKLVNCFKAKWPEKWARVKSIIDTLVNDHYSQKQLNNDRWDITEVDPVVRAQPAELSSADKAKFYGLIYDSLGRVFEVSDDIYHLVYLHIQPDSELTLNDLAKLAYYSLIKTNQGYQVNLTKFQNKINEALHPIQPKINDYETFWRDLINYDDFTINVKYQQLFETVSPENFCLKFLKTQKLGAKWKKWIDGCVKEEFSAGTINLIISFTQVWIKKLNIKYLENVSETCADNGKNFQEILKHFKSVIINDMETKDNRLKVTYQPHNNTKINLFPTSLSNTDHDEQNNNEYNDLDLMINLLNNN